MKTVTFEIKSRLKFQLDMVVFPELTSPRKWIQKGITILRNNTPRVLRYLSRQKVMSELKGHKIILETDKPIGNKHVKKLFKIWIHKEKMKRFILVVIEGVILPFTPILALLPGPNVFFYVPALLFYYHLRSFLGLKKLHVGELDIEVKHIEKTTG